MTEQEWLESVDPDSLLGFLQGKMSERKLRLFACACVRAWWPLLTAEQSQNAVVVAEQYADGRATDEELSAAHDAAYESAVLARSEESHREAEDADAEESYVERQSGDEDSEETTRHARLSSLSLSFTISTTLDSNRYAAAQTALAQLGDSISAIIEPSDAEDRSAQASILRDIVGNPFRSLNLDLAWQTPTVLLLATAAYDERILPSGHLEVDRLAVLADELEDAGCTDAEILGHLRGPGPHVRGCWVLNSLLDRK